MSDLQRQRLQTLIGYTRARIDILNASAPWGVDEDAFLMDQLVMELEPLLAAQKPTEPT